MAFFKHNLVTGWVLVEVALNGWVVDALAERLPEPVLIDIANQSHRSVLFAAQRNLIISRICEERIVRVTSAGGQCSSARHEHPVVAGANKRHEEIRQFVTVADAEVGFSIEVDVFIRRFRVGGGV